MTGVCIRKHVKTRTWRGEGVKLQPECGRMTYNMGHQGARRGPWTVSLLGALERFHASRLRNRRRIHLCLKFVAMCYSSPWKLRQACSQKNAAMFPVPGAQSSAESGFILCFPSGPEGHVEAGGAVWAAGPPAPPPSGQLGGRTALQPLRKAAPGEEGRRHRRVCLLV